MELQLQRLFFHKRVKRICQNELFLIRSGKYAYTESLYNVNIMKIFHFFVCWYKIGTLTELTSRKIKIKLRNPYGNNFYTNHTTKLIISN